MVAAMARTNPIHFETGEQPRLIERLIVLVGSGRKLCTALGVGDDYQVRWRREGFLPGRYAYRIEEMQLTDSWGGITALDVLKAEHDAVAARKARREVEARARLAALEAHLASLAEADSGGPVSEQ